MDKASSAVKNFLSSHGKEDTKVTENIAPAVTHENVTPTRHENVTTAVDKEVHQDHYHTSVQPVQDTKVLPEQHKHNLAAVDHRSHDHTNDDETRRRLAAEQAKHQDERTISDTKHSQSVNPVVAGEHRHHHLHETIQPVVERETIQPEVVHTTVPIHETHHEAAKHHTSSTLPAMTMNEFSASGGGLQGRGDRTETFEGAPHSTSTAGSMSASGSKGTTLGTEGLRGGSGATGTSATAGGVGGVGAGSGSEYSSTGAETHKPSLKEKMNPKIDADGDGKAGFMS